MSNPYIAFCASIPACVQMEGVSVTLAVLAFLGIVYSIWASVRCDPSHSAWPVIVSAGLAMAGIGAGTLAGFVVSISPYSTDWAALYAVSCVMLALSTWMLVHPVLRTFTKRAKWIAFNVYLWLAVYVASLIPQLLLAVNGNQDAGLVFFLMIIFVSFFMSLGMFGIGYMLKHRMAMMDRHEAVTYTRLSIVQAMYVCTFLVMCLCCILQILQSIDLQQTGVSTTGNFFVTYFFYQLCQLVWACLNVYTAKTGLWQETAHETTATTILPTTDVEKNNKQDVEAANTVSAAAAAE